MNEVIKKWTLHNFPNLDSFVIAGASAGSLGGRGMVRLPFEDFKYQKASVILDSYIGLFPQAVVGKLVQSFDICNLPPVATSAYLKENCDADTGCLEACCQCHAESSGRCLLCVEFKSDVVQQIFYGLVGDAFGSWDKTTLSRYVLLPCLQCVPCFVCYIIDGSDHVFTLRGSSILRQQGLASMCHLLQQFSISGSVNSWEEHGQCPLL